jgi:hypothetical protein
MHLKFMPFLCLMTCASAFGLAVRLLLADHEITSGMHDSDRRR